MDTESIDGAWYQEYASAARSSDSGTRERVTRDRAATMLIGKDEIHVWVARLDLDNQAAARIGTLLEPEEQARVRRFPLEVQRRRFLARRGARRSILARYLGVDPGALRFLADPSGKPYIAGTGSGLEFNESHSGDLGLYALSRGRSVGVDVEKLRDIPEREEIIRSFASEAERAVWAGIPIEERCAAFLRWWTLKEAFVKALGLGLKASLAEFTVAYAPESRVAIRDQRLVPTHGRSWQAVDLAPAPGYVGALVRNGPLERLQLQAWHPEV